MSERETALQRLVNDMYDPYWWPVVRFCVGSALFFLGLEVAYRSELRGYRPKRVTNGLAVLSFLLAFGGIALALAGLL